MIERGSRSAFELIFWEKKQGGRGSWGAGKKDRDAKKIIEKKQGKKGGRKEEKTSSYW